MIWVTDARVLSRYRLWVRFSDDSEGEVDLREMIFNDARPIVGQLKEESSFADMRVDSDTVVWGNGFDLAPEYLYEQVRAHSAA